MAPLAIFVSVPGLLTLTGAVALMCGGIALVASEIRGRREVLARRVDLLQPIRALKKVETEVLSSKNDPFRLRESGMSEALQREIARAVSRLGLSSNRATVYFAAGQLIVGAIVGVLVFLWARNVAAFAAIPMIPFLIMAMAAIIGWFLPKLFINYKVKQRTKLVRTGLPEALELLVVCAEAGLSLEDGLSRVVKELQRSQPQLADELALTLADLRILPSREKALTNLAERVAVPSVRTIVTTLAQSLRYGTPLAQALRVVASEMRTDFLIEMEERASRLPAYMTVPVMLFLMPTIFLVVGGPAALQLLDSFRGVQLVPG